MWEQPSCGQLQPLDSLQYLLPLGCVCMWLLLQCEHSHKPNRARCLQPNRLWSNPQSSASSATSPCCPWPFALTSVARRVTGKINLFFSWWLPQPSSSLCHGRGHVPKGAGRDWGRALGGSVPWLWTGTPRYTHGLPHSLGMVPPNDTQVTLANLRLWELPAAEQGKDLAPATALVPPALGPHLQHPHFQSWEAELTDFCPERQWEFPCSSCCTYKLRHVPVFRCAWFRQFLQESFVQQLLRCPFNSSGQSRTTSRPQRGRNSDLGWQHIQTACTEPTRQCLELPCSGEKRRCFAEPVTLRSQLAHPIRFIWCVHLNGMLARAHVPGKELAHSPWAVHFAALPVRGFGCRPNNGKTYFGEVTSSNLGIPHLKQRYPAGLKAEAIAQQRKP